MCLFFILDKAFTTGLNVLLSAAAQHSTRQRGTHHEVFGKRTLSAAVIAMLGAGSAAQAAMINFTLATIDGTPTYSGGATLDVSSSLDFDEAFLVVSEVGPDNASGLIPGGFNVTISPSDISYGGGMGPTTLPVSVIETWTGDNNDMFTEKLTEVDSINRLTLDQIIVNLSGTVSDSDGLFVNTPAFLVVNATQFGGPGTGTSAMFTSTAGAVIPTIPESSTWVMMTLGFGALGCAGFRRRMADGAMLSV